MQEQKNLLTGALIGLARPTDGNAHLIHPGATRVILEGLAATAGAPDTAEPAQLMARVEEEKRKMVPDCFTCACPCGKNNAYNMAQLQTEPPEVRHLKEQLLASIQAIALCLRRCEPGSEDEAAERFLYKGLIALGMEGWTPERLQPVLLEAEEIHSRCLSRQENDVPRP